MALDQSERTESTAARGSKADAPEVVDGQPIPVERTEERSETDSGRTVHPWTAVAYLWQADRRLAVCLWVASVGTALINVGVLFAFTSLAGAIPNHLRSHGRTAPLIALLVVAVALFVAAAVLPPLVEMLGATAKAAVRKRVLDGLLTAILRPTGIAHLEQTTTRNRLVSATGEAARVSVGDSAVLWITLVSSQISGYAACFVIAIHIWWMGLVLLLMWAFVRRLVRGAFMEQAVRQYHQTTSRRRALYLAALLSHARDAKEVRVFNLGSFVVGKFRSNQRRAISAALPTVRRVHRRACLGLAVVLATYATLGGILAHRAFDGELGFREMVVVLLMLAMTATIGTVSWNDVLLSHGLTTIPDIQHVESIPGPAETSAGRTQAKLDGDIRFDHVRFRYPDRDTDTLVDVCLELPAGHSAALVGQNGAGKSTIVSLLLGLRAPTAGTLLVGGRPLPPDPGSRWQERIAIVSQHPARFPTTLYRNVAMGSLAHCDDEDGVRESLRRTGLTDLVSALPNGLATVLNRTLPGGVDLSGGQWQRVALARAMFAIRHGAQVLVLDEPTAAMDIESEARFHDRFFDLTSGITTLVVSHRFSSVRRAEQIFVLGDGRVVEQGTHDELVAADGDYRRLYEIQARSYR